MKILILLLALFASPMQEVENIKLSLPTRQQDIFLEYSNANFNQSLKFDNRHLTVEIQSFNYLDLKLNYRVIPDHNYIQTLNPEIQHFVKQFFDDSQSLRNFMTKLSVFLKRHLRYSRDSRLKQDPDSVIYNRRGSCVGYSNLVKVFLRAANIESAPVKGFYLKRTNGKTWTPIPHRWIEIRLPDGMRFFYDPQYQDFSANYITTRNDVDFKKIRKFKVRVINTSIKIIN